MPWIDYAIIALVALSAVIGLFRGFVREALSLLAWAAAIFVALSFAPLAGAYLEPYIETNSIRHVAAFAGLFLATLIVGAIINYLLVLLVRKSGIGGTDRFLGLIFGVARGGVVVAILVLLAGLTPLPEDAWWQESQTIPHFEKAAVWMRGFLPEDVAGDFMFDNLSLPTALPAVPVGGTEGS